MNQFRDGIIIILPECPCARESVIVAQCAQGANMREYAKCACVYTQVVRGVFPSCAVGVGRPLALVRF